MRDYTDDPRSTEELRRQGIDVVDLTETPPPPPKDSKEQKKDKEELKKLRQENSKLKSQVAKLEGSTSKEKTPVSDKAKRLKYLESRSQSRLNRPSVERDRSR